MDFVYYRGCSSPNTTNNPGQNRSELPGGVQKFMVQNWVGCVSGVHVGTGFICYKHGLDAGKDGWTRREWYVAWPRIWTLQAMCLSWLNCFQLLIAVLEMMASEASLLGFKVNWQKTKVQAMGTRVNVPSTVTIQGQQTAVVDKFLGSLIHSSTQSTLRHHTPQRYQSCSDDKLRNHFCKSYVNFGDQPDSFYLNNAEAL